MQILGILAPTFLLIAFGAALLRSKFVSPEFLREGNRVVYWFGLPALLFNELASASFSVGGPARLMVGAMLAATVVLIMLSYAGAWLLRLPASSTGTFVQGAFRGNLAFVGLPIIYSFPESLTIRDVPVRTIAVMTVAPMLVIYNVVGIVVLLASQLDVRRLSGKYLLQQIVTTPPLLATLAGMAYAATGWPWPVVLHDSFDALAQLALPLALLGIGGALVSTPFGGEWHAPLSAALLKTVAAPAVGWLCGRWLGLGALELKLVMVLLATPTAIISYTKVIELEGSPALASGSIVFSTVLSIVALAGILALF
ncbi:MAG TPA: AEC family transporter [Opitutaceae bacterium]|nr:AEC family transporter [Opitutaceae bacterium]